MPVLDHHARSTHTLIVFCAVISSSMPASLASVSIAGSVSPCKADWEHGGKKGREGRGADESVREKKKSTCQQ